MVAATKISSHSKNILQLYPLNGIKKDKPIEIERFEENRILIASWYKKQQL